MPRESGSLIGISFYSIIIKPLLKLYKKEYELNDEEMIEFMKESIKQAFKTWIKYEPNNTLQIKEYINDLLSSNKLHTLEEFEHYIYDEAATRLFRDKIIPNKIKNLAKMKLPMIIELASNNYEHLIKDTISQKISRKAFTIEEIKKLLFKPIMKYIGVFKSGDIETPNIQKPNEENINELLEFQQLYDLNIDIIFEKIKDESIKITDELIEEIIISNKNTDKDNIIIPTKLQTYINKVRNNIPNLSKERAYMSEAILEKISSDYNTTYVNDKKRKPGRPKKIKEEESLNTKIDNFFKNN